MLKNLLEMRETGNQYYLDWCGEFRLIIMTNNFGRGDIFAVMVQLILEKFVISNYGSVRRHALSTDRDIQ